MRLALLSDIHANLEALQDTLRDLATQDVDRVVCLGDIVGYNADPAACVALVRALEPVCVAGNHDRAVCGQITTEGFGHTAARAVTWTRGRLDGDALDYLAGLPLRASVGHHLVAVHGALHPEIGCEMVRLEDDEGRRRSFDALVAHPSGSRVCAFGHTHRLGIWELDGGHRAGADGRRSLPSRELPLPRQPRHGRAAPVAGSAGDLPRVRHGAGVIEVRRVAYDATVPLAKTRAAGLAQPFTLIPPALRGRLKQGARALGLDRLVKRRLAR
jgi:predicted phosphodiesterase